MTIQEKILNIADRIIVINAGKVQYDGVKEDVLPKLNMLNTCQAIK